MCIWDGLKLHELIAEWHIVLLPRRHLICTTFHFIVMVIIVLFRNIILRAVELTNETPNIFRSERSREKESLSKYEELVVHVIFELLDVKDLTRFSYFGVWKLVYF